MQKLTFKKDQIIASFWDNDTETWQDRSLAESSLPLSWFLPYETFVEDGVTLRDILTLLEPHSQYINIIFLNYLKGLPFQELLEKVNQVNQEDLGLSVDAVCLMWISEIKPIDGDDMPSIQVYPTMMSLEMSDDEDAEEDEFHSIHDISPTQLLDSSLAIDDIFEIYEEAEPDELIFEGVTNWTLYDFIRTIVNEVSTYAIVLGVLNRADLKTAEAPISSTELFEHMSDLDNFFNISQNVNGKRR